MDGREHCMTIQFKTARQTAGITVARLSQVSGVDARKIYQFEAGGVSALTPQEVDAVFNGMASLTGQSYNVTLKARMLADDIMTTIAKNQATARTMPGAPGTQRGRAPWQTPERWG
jgi:pyrroline-5-carboxylate reductase